MMPSPDFNELDGHIPWHFNSYCEPSLGLAFPVFDDAHTNPFSWSLTVSPNAAEPVFPFQFIDLDLNRHPTVPISPINLGSDSSSDSSSENAFSVPSSTSTTNLSLPSSDDEISGHDIGSVSDDDDDGEYLPSPSAYSTPNRHRRARPPTSVPRKARSESPPARSPRKSPYPTAKRVRAAPPSRVRQVDGELANMMRDALGSTDRAIRLNFKCPDPLCGFNMKAKSRMPDFRRHLKAHLREADSGEGRYVCKGIAFDDFYDLPEEKRRAIESNELGGEPYIVAGEKRIGGCRQSFSRGDALTRHIKSRSNACAGLVSGHLQGC